MAEYKVTDKTSLSTALSKAQGGDTILLAAGNYGTISITNKNYTSPLIIASADGDNKAVANRLVVTNSSNVTLKGIEVAGLSTTTDRYYAEISKSKSITLDGMSIHGTLDDDPTADKSGLSILSSQNVTIKNSEFQQGYRAMMVEKSQSVTISGNHIHDIRSDGIDLAQVNNLTIDSNRIENFHQVGADHPDAIQLWTTDTTAQSYDIKITNNQILGGPNGSGMQGIFMKDEIGIGFHDVLIENNLIYDTKAYTNGITIAGGSDSIIRGNTVANPVSVSSALNIRLERAHNVTVENNISDGYNIADTNDGLSFSGNSTLRKNQSLYATRLTRKLTETATTGYNLLNLVVPGVGYHIAGAGAAIDLAGYAAIDAGGLAANDPALEIGAGTLADAMVPMAPSPSESLLWSDWASLTADGGADYASLVTNSATAPVDLAAGLAA